MRKDNILATLRTLKPKSKRPHLRAEEVALLLQQQHALQLQLLRMRPSPSQDSLPSQDPR